MPLPKHKVIFGIFSMDDKMRFSAIILAAGLSTRFGDQNKLLYKMEGKPVLQTVIGELEKSRVADIVVVTGHQADLICRILAPTPTRRVVYNDDFYLGMSTSISKGIKQLYKGTDACLICLGDLPQITAMDYDFIMDEFTSLKRVDQILVPVCQGIPGHPVIFGSLFFGDLEALTPADHGAKTILDGNPANVRIVDVGHERILMDLDFYP